jgi:membrane protein
LTWRELASQTWAGINQNDLLNRAYELAYNFLLAVFPLLLFLSALLGIFASQGNKLLSDLFAYMQGALPRSAYSIVLSTVQEVTRSPDAGKITFGLVSAFYFGSGGMTQLISTLNAAYEVRETRSWLKVHLKSLALTVAMSLLIVGALLLVVAGGWIGVHLIHNGRANPIIAICGEILRWILALGSVVLGFSIIYYYAPNLPPQRTWRWITPGSVIGSFLWGIASGALRVYLHFFDTYSKVYGSLGAVIILLLWFYITGLAFLIGGQVNSTILHAAARMRPEQTMAEDRKAA